MPLLSASEPLIGSSDFTNAIAAWTVLISEGKVRLLFQLDCLEWTSTHGRLPPRASRLPTCHYISLFRHSCEAQAL